MNTAKNRQDFDLHFEVKIYCKDKKVVRSVLLDGEIIYQEYFGSSTSWFYGGGNPVLDLFEKRFLHRFKERENTCCYRCDISGSGKGIRLVLSKLLHLQIQFFNILLKNFIFCRKTSNP